MMRSLLASVFAAVLLSACGGSDSSSQSSNTPQPTTTSQVLNGVVIKRTTEGDTDCEKLETGIDTNSNGILDTNEVQNSYSICASPTFKVENNVADSSCANLATKLYIGIDRDYSGSLDSTEISETHTFCQGAANAAEEAFSQSAMAIISGSIPTPSSTSIIGAQATKSVTSKTGDLWLTPNDILLAIQANEASKKNLTTESEVAPPKIEPIKVPVDANGKYSLEVPAGTDYTLSYTTDSQGVQLGNINVSAGTMITKDIETTDLVELSSIELSIQDLNGNKLSDASIAILSGAGGSNNADDQGMILLEKLAAGSHSILISAPGHVSQMKSIQLEPGSNPALTLQINTLKGKATGQIRANALDNLGNIIVYAQDIHGNVYTSITNQSGIFEFPALPVGEGYSFIAFANDLDSAKIDGVAITQSQASYIGELTLTPSAKKTGNLTGYALFEEKVGENSHAGIIISIEGTDKEAITSRDGAFVINDLDPGTYTVNFTDSNHKTTTKTNVVIAQGTTQNLDATTLESLTGEISGRITDANNNGIEGATVTLVGHGSTSTNGNGEYVFANTPVGQYTLRASSSYFSTKEATVTIENNATTSRDFELEAKLVTGRVTLEGAEPDADLGAISVVVDGLGITTSTNSAGEYSLREVPQGVQVLFFTKAGYQSLPVKITVPESGLLNVPKQTLQSASVANARLIINDGVEVTNSLDLSLSLSAANARYMQLAEDNSYENADQIDYLNVANFVLSPGEGKRFVYARFIDNSGSTSTNVAVASDTIFVDTVAPVITAISPAQTNTTTIALNIKAVDGEIYESSGIAAVELSNDNETFQRFAWDGSNLIDWSFDGVKDGKYQVYLAVVDKAGNRSPVKTHEITLDTTAPTAAEVSLISQATKLDDIHYVASDKIALSTSSLSSDTYWQYSFSKDFLAAQSVTNNAVEVTLPQEGHYSLSFRTLDRAGNKSEVSHLNVVYDKTAPEVGVFAQTPNVTNSTDFSLNLSTPFTDENLKQVEVKGGTSSNWVKAVDDELTWTLRENIQNTLYARAVDMAGNISNIIRFDVTHDNRKPITSASPSAGSFAEAQLISLANNESVDIFYSLNGGVEQAYSDPISLTEDGTYTLVYYSVDQSGNSEEPLTSVYTIDTQKPTLSIDPKAAAFNSYQKPKVVAEDLSNVTVRYALSKNTSEPTLATKYSTLYSDSNGLPLNSDGEWIVSLYAVDAVGNSNSYLSGTYRIDSTAPTLSNDTEQGYYPADTILTVKLSASDEQDQSPTIYYTTDGTEPTLDSDFAAIDASISVSGLGTHIIKAIAVDDLGNQSDVQTYSYQLATTLYDSETLTIEADTVFTKDNSPYRILGSLTIAEGATLTIQPGVELWFSSTAYQSQYGSKLLVNGTLIAEGTSANPILMKGLNDDYWSGIQFNDTAIDAAFDSEGYVSGSLVRNVVIQKPYYGLYIYNSSPAIEQLTIENPFVGIQAQYSASKIQAINIIEADRYALELHSNDGLSIEDSSLSLNSDIDRYDTLLYVGGGNVNTTLRYNDFILPTLDDEAIAVKATYSSSTIDLRENYFSTNNFASMQWVIGSSEDSNYAGNITYIPALSASDRNEADFDGDGIVDYLDTDDDNDGYSDEDEFSNSTSPFDNTDTPLDTDGDFIGDNTDRDDDNDGLLDSDEILAGSNPLDASSTVDVVSGGTLAEDTNWPLTPNSIVYVKGNIFVPVGKTLTIEAGTTVRFADDYLIQVEGQLVIDGSADKRVSLVPRIDENNEARWRGIKFMPTAIGAEFDSEGNYLSGSRISYADISYTSTTAIVIAVTDSEDGTIPANQRCNGKLCNIAPWLDHVSIDTTDNNGLYAGYTKQLRATNLDISGAWNWTLYSSNVDAIYLSNSVLNDEDGYYWNRGTQFTDSIDVYLTNNQFINNDLSIIAERFTSSDNLFDRSKNAVQSATWSSLRDIYKNTNASINITNANATLQDTRLMENVGGININGSTVEVNSLIATGVTGNTLSSTNSKLSIQDSTVENSYQALVSSNSILVLENNVFSNNAYGIEINSAKSTIISNNDISGNKYSGLTINSQNSDFSYSKVTNNTITGNNEGIKIAVDAKVQFNHITDNLVSGLTVSRNDINLDVAYNNIYGNGTDTVGNQDNGHYDIINNRSQALVVSNNYHGSPTDRGLFDTFNRDIIDDSNLGYIRYNSYLSTPIDWVNSTSSDLDNDGLPEHLDLDDDNDGYPDLIETNISVLSNPHDGQSPNPDTQSLAEALATADSDFDGISNEDDPDDDNDGLSDTEEERLGTDPLLSDSDGDGFSDLVEVNNATDPTKIDMLPPTISEDFEISGDWYSLGTVIVNGAKLKSDSGATVVLLGNNQVEVQYGEIHNIKFDATDVQNYVSSVYIPNGAVAQLVDVAISHSNYYAVSIATDTDIKIFDLSIFDSENGIYTSSSSLEIDGLHIKDFSQYGIHTYYNSYLDLKNAKIENGKVGIDASSGSNIFLSQSEFKGITERAFYGYSLSHALIENNLFRLNDEAIYTYNSGSNSYTTVRNNTFDQNHIAVSYANANDQGQTDITNNLFTANVWTLQNVGASATIAGNAHFNTKRDEALAAGDALLGSSPYQAYELGTTTAAVVINTQSNTSTLVDSTLSLPVDSLAGAWLQPDATSDQTFEVVSNTATSVTVKGLIPEASRPIGMAYTLLDWRIADEHAAQSAGVDNAVVGAFVAETTYPSWGYRTYTRDLTLEGDITTNQLWSGDVNLTGSVTVKNGFVRMQRDTSVWIPKKPTSGTYTIQFDEDAYLLQEPRGQYQFASAEETPTNQDWNQIYLRSRWASMLNTKISNAHYGVKFSGNAFTADNLDIEEIYYYGLNIDGFANISNTHIKNTQRGIYQNSGELRLISSVLENSEYGVSSSSYVILNIEQSEFRNLSDRAISAWNTANAIIENNLFRLNDEGIYITNYGDRGYSTVIRNNTFDQNHIAVSHANANDQGQTDITNNLFTDNVWTLQNVGASATIAGNAHFNTKRDKALAAGDTLLDSSPYQAYELGTTTTAVAIDTQNNTSTIVDSTLSLPVDSLAGAWLQPDATSDQIFEVVSNTATGVTVRGLIPEASRPAGMAYTLLDWRIADEHAAQSAGVDNTVVGAFVSENTFPSWGYRTYTRDLTLEGDITTNQLWSGDVNLTGSVTVKNGFIRMQRDTSVWVPKKPTSGTYTIQFDEDAYLLQEPRGQYQFASAEENPTNQDWNQLYLRSRWANILNTKISHANYGVKFTGSALTADNLDIEDIYYYGLNIDGFANISNTHIKNTQRGIYQSSGELHLTDSIIERSAYGVDASSYVVLDIRQSEFRNNTVKAIEATNTASAVIENNLFRLNDEAIHAYNSANLGHSTVIRNNTFDQNHIAVSYANANDQGQTDITNNLFTDNVWTLQNVGTSATIAGNAHFNTKRDESLASGDTLLDSSPYRAYELGTTTAAVVINTQSNTSTIVDSTLSLPVDLLAGAWLQPDATSDQTFEVVSNTATSVTVKGLIPEASRPVGMAYTLLDWRIADEHAAQSAGVDNTVVGAFVAETTYPSWGYRTYTRDLTLEGNITTNQLWSGDVNLTGSVTVKNGFVRMQRDTSVWIPRSGSSKFSIQFEQDSYLIQEPRGHYQFSSSESEPSNSDWSGLDLNSRWGEIENTAISYAARGVDFVGSALNAKNLEISNISLYGFDVDGFVTIENSHITNVQYGINQSAGDLYLTDSIIENATRGVSASSHVGLDIRQSEFRNLTSYAIYGTHTGNVLIENNLIRLNDEALHVYNYTNSGYSIVIRNNTFDQNRVAIQYANSDDQGQTEITNNLFTANLWTLQNIDASATVSGNAHYDTKRDETLAASNTLLDSSPYRAYELGTTTATVAVDTQNNTSTIEDSTLSLAINTLAGAWLQPDATSDRTFEVISNTATSVTVKGLIPEASRPVGMAYTLLDWRISDEHAAQFADVDNTVVGAFVAENAFPSWGYRTYTRDLTLEGDITTNQLWSGNISLTGDIDVTIGNTVRLQRGTEVVMAPGTANKITFEDDSFYLSEPRGSYAFDVNGTANDTWGGLYIASSFVQFSDTRIQHAKYAALTISDLVLAEISNSEFSNSGTGIYNLGALEIDSSRFYNNGIGMELSPRGYDVTSLILSGSEFNQNGTSIYNRNSDSNRPLHIKNTLIRNTATAFNNSDTSNYLNIKNITVDNATTVFSNYLATNLTNSIFSNSNSFGSGSQTFQNNAGFHIASTSSLITTVESNPYESVYDNNYRILDGHIASTMASDGGELGMYGGEGASFAWLGQGVNLDPTPASDRTLVGTLEGNQYWDGTTTLTGDLTIPFGSVFKLAEGATIKIPSGNKIVVNGQLDLEGTANNPVIFSSTSDTPAAGDWDALEINTMTDIKHINVLYSDRGIVLNADYSTVSNVFVEHSLTTGIDSNASHIKITQSMVKDSSNKGIELRSFSLLSESSILGAEIGIIQDGVDNRIRENLIYKTNEAINSQNNSTSVENNIIVSSSTGFNSYSSSNYYKEAKNNIFYTISDKAIYVRDSKSNLNYNIISGLSGSENYGLHAYYGTQYYGNTYFDIDTPFYSQHDSSIYSDTRYPSDLIADPMFISPSDEINTDGLKPGIWGLLEQGKVDFRLAANSPLQHHSEYGGQIGPYALINKVTSSFNLYETVSNYRDWAYLANGEQIDLTVTVLRELENLSDLVVNFSQLDSNFDASKVEIRQLDTGFDMPQYQVSYTISEDNTIADGNISMPITVTINGLTQSLDFTPWQLDNTGPTVELTGISNDATISADTVVHAKLIDSGIGGNRFEYSLDQGSSWIAGDEHIRLSSSGYDDGNTAALLINNINAMPNTPGVNIVELDPQTFMPIADTAIAFDSSYSANTYLTDLAEDVLIAVAIKGKVSPSDISSSFQTFGFKTDWDNNDAFIGVGYKGPRKVESVSYTQDSGTGNPLEISLTTRTDGNPLMNASITLPADISGEHTLWVRAIDFLGNVGEPTKVTYTVK